MNKLTPAAKEALDELSQEYYNGLLEKAFKIAQRRQTVDREISLRDIIEAQDRELKGKSNIEGYQDRKKRWSTLISLSGATYAAAGITIYLWQNNKFNIEQDLGLIIAIVGILITLVGYFYAQILPKRMISIGNYKESEVAVTSDSDLDLVKRWQIIERLASEKLSDKDKHSFRSILQYLSENYTSSDNEMMKLKQLLDLRNRILHESYGLSKHERTEYLEFADNLIDKLEKTKKTTAHNKH